MLVLNRKAGESITLTTESGERIEFTVTKIKGVRCSISFDAPRTVNIVRSELKENPDMEERAA